VEEMRSLKVYALSIFILFAAQNVWSKTKDVFTLEQAMAITMQKQYQILIQKFNIDSAKGRLLSAGAAFDTRVDASAAYTKTDTPLTSSQSAASGHSTIETHNQTYSLTVTKPTRTGISVSSQLSLASNINDTYDTQDDNSRTLGVSLGIPWFDITDGNSIALREKSAKEDTETALYTFYHQVSASLYNTMTAWWNYLAAYEKLDIYQKYENEISDYMNTLYKLIDSGKIPQLDLQQLNAKHTSTLMEIQAAKNTLNNAEFALSNILGVQHDKELFANPEIKTTNVEALLSQAPTIAENAVDHRFDIKAARVSLKSSNLLLQSLKRDKKPNVNLIFSVSGTEKMDDSLTDQADNSGVAASMQLTFSMPVANTYTNGLIMQQTSALRQVQTTLSEQERTTDIAVQAALEDMKSKVKISKLAVEALKLYTDALAKEKDKLSEGKSTILDVLTSEDNYKTALLQMIDIELSLAQATSTFAYSSGSLITVDGDQMVVNKKFLPHE